MTARTVPVIAVFGGTSPSVLDAAEMLGASIVGRRQCVLLTGAAEPGDRAVHKRAVKGAAAAQDRTRIVGVVRRKGPAQNPSDDEISGLLIDPGQNHKRNYVEAVLCDAAIALPGSDGTLSEIAFCAALQRPVILLDGDWEDGRRAATLTLHDLLAGVEDLVVKDKTASPLDPLIDHARSRLGSLDGLSFDIRASPTTTAEADRIVDLILERLGLAPWPGNSVSAVPEWIDMIRGRGDMSMR